MKKISVSVLSFIVTLLLTIPVQAQDNIKDLFDQQFSYASRVLQLAEAMPADKYSWRPMEGVSSVGEVYLHIAQANYGMLGALDISAPEGVDLSAIDTNDKESVVAALSQSIDFAKSAVADLPASKLNESTELYGRSLNGEGVLVFMLNHMSEHVGQSIAYARMNEVVPPWSE